MGSCNLGPSFPTWLKSQQEIDVLDLSNASISDFVPNWFWSGMPRMALLSLSQNHLSGQIPKSIGEMWNYLESINFSRNNFTGRIPSSLSKLYLLLVLDLSSNNFSGAIPYSLGQLNSLQILHLSNNQLSGKLPASFINLSFLKSLDLGNNKLSGEIPTWFGGFPYLSIIILRSNAFFGEIPSELSKLSSLQVLDIAENNLSGHIPKSFGNTIAMAGDQKAMAGDQLYDTYIDNRYYQVNLVVNAKSQSLMYTNTFFLVTSIDLSGNNLSGRFPEEITKLSGLLILNLSRNHIIGNIPESVSNMHQLQSLDLSSNQLTGSIPQNLSSLSFLGYLNLSYNNLSGAIPYTGHMTTFEASSFVGNPDLYGCPLPVRCPHNGDDQVNGSNRGASNDETSDPNDGLIDKWFNLSVGLGYAAGLLVPFLIFAMKRSWSDAYFDFVEVVIVKFLVLMRRRRINHGRRTRPHRHRQ